jgi:hypothetical protein
VLSSRSAVAASADGGGGGDEGVEQGLVVVRRLVAVAEAGQPAGVQQHLVDRGWREEAEMGAVEQAVGVVAEVAAEQALDDGDVRHVGDAADEASVGAGDGGQRREQGFGGAEMLDQVAEDDGVVVALEASEPVGLDVEVPNCGRAWWRPGRGRGRGGRRRARRCRGGAP